MRSRWQRTPFARNLEVRTPCRQKRGHKRIIKKDSGIRVKTHEATTQRIIDPRFDQTPAAGWASVMKNRFSVFCNDSHGSVYYLKDNKTGQRTSLHTTDKALAKGLIVLLVVVKAWAETRSGISGPNPSSPGENSARRTHVSAASEISANRTGEAGASGACPVHPGRVVSRFRGR